MVELECIDDQPHSSSTRSSEGGFMSLERELDAYSKILAACNECVRNVHSPTFNIMQCQYLVEKLKDVIESAGMILKTSSGALIALHAPMGVEKYFSSFQLLLVLATEIEKFMEGCSKDAWLPNAMALTNASEFVSYIGFHLELCQAAFCEECGASGRLNLDQVVEINKAVIEIVKTKTSMDKEDLLKKLSLVLPSLHGDEKDLASYLLQRLLREVLVQNKPPSKSKWDFLQNMVLFRSISTNVNEEVLIGRGSSSTVFKATWLGMKVARKVYFGKYNPDFKKEIDICARLCHPNITSIFCYAQERRKCSIFMELMDKDLFTLIQERLEVSHDSFPFNIWEAVDIMHQIAEGGRYLHEQRIVHRDLKSSNILVKSAKMLGSNLEYIQVKVTDFGISKIYDNNTTNSEQTMNVGSNRWMAPELIQLESIDNQINIRDNNRPVSKYPFKCDIYSFAIVCYEIFTGELPFWSESNEKVKAMVLKGDRPKLPAQCPFHLRALIEKCWNPEPKSRPSFDHICRELKYVKYVLMTDPSISFKIHEEVNRMTNKDVEALEDINKVLEPEPIDAWTLRNRGEGKRLMGKYIDALKDFNKADEIEPNNAFTLGSRGEVKRLLGEYVDALSDLNKADELEPNDALTLKRRGEVKRMMGKYVEALEDFKKANELEPNDPFTLGTHGDVKRLMGKYEDALKDLNEADEFKPDDPFTLASRGDVKKMMGKYIDALEDFNKADKIEPNNALTLGNRGEVKQLMGKYLDALEDFNKADKLEPNDAWTLRNRGEVNRLMGKYVDALEDLNKANELEPNDALTLKRRGDVKRMMGKYVHALEDFNKANEVQPNDAFTLGSRGEVKRLMGNYEDALEDFNMANELQPNDAWILRNRGDVKRMMDKYIDALEDLNKAIELEPNDALTLNRRGDVKRMMGKYVDALEDFDTANGYEPNNAFTLESRGEMKQLMGKYIDALEDFNKVDELRPNDTWLKEVGNMSSLITLNLSGCSSLVALPKELGNLFSLVILDLSRCSSLIALPKEVGNLYFLITLNLSQCSNLTALPKEVGNLSSLTTLNLEDCPNLTILPKEVGNLVSLTTLNLWRCSSLAALPKEVGNLSSLTTLNLRQCSSLMTLPEEVGNLSSLASLNLEDRSSLATWPKEVENSSSLMTLNFEKQSSKAQIETIGDEEHVPKKRQKDAILTHFKVKYDLSTNLNDTIQKPLLKILSSLTIRGLHVLDSLLPWVQSYTGICQQVLSWNKGKVESKYLITRHFLGQGCSGIFYETTWTLQSKMRLARKDFPGVRGDSFETEAIRLFELTDHPNVVKTFCWTVDNRSCSLAMEYMKVDLSSFMRKKKEALRKTGDQAVIVTNPSPFQLLEALAVLSQIAMGVEHIHDEGIYHGDLKPSNIFLDWKEGQILVKVADFGLLVTKRNTTLLSQQALCFRMVEWSAPELFENYFTSMREDLDFLWPTSPTELDPSTSGASSSENGPEIVMEKADCYSFGLTSAYVLGGGQMWPAQFSLQELRKQISRNGLRPELPSECPETLKSLIHACWDPNPTYRPTFSTIRKTMQDIIKEQLEVSGSL